MYCERVCKAFNYKDKQLHTLTYDALQGQQSMLQVSYMMNL